MDAKVIGVILTAGAMVFAGGVGWSQMDTRVVVVENTQEKIGRWLDYDQCLDSCVRTCAENGILPRECNCQRCDKLREKVSQ